MLLYILHAAELAMVCRASLRSSSGLVERTPWRRMCFIGLR